MWHKQRIWTVTQVDLAEDLAAKLSQHTWTGCAAFTHRGYLFANDSTSADGAQEYAILRPNRDGDQLAQIESITFSWCNESRAYELIREIVSGKYDSDEFDRVYRGRFQTYAEHGTCPLCA